LLRYFHDLVSTLLYFFNEWSYAGNWSRELYNNKIGKGGLNNYKNSTVLNKKLITKINYVLLGFIKINFKWLAVILLKKLKDIIKYYLS